MRFYLKTKKTYKINKLKKINKKFINVNQKFKNLKKFLFFKLTKFNNNLIFSAKNNNTYNKLWRSDGTNLGTIELKDINLNQTSNSELKFLEFNSSMICIET